MATVETSRVEALMSAEDEIEIGPLRRDEIPEVARFHCRWFGPGSELQVDGASLAMLGGEFLASAFYTANFDNPNLHVHVARWDGRIVGFNVFASDRRAVGRHALLRHLPRLVGSTLLALVRHPLALVHLLSNLKYLRGEDAAWLRDDDAHWLVFTVEPELRSQEFVERTGRRLTAEMFGAMEEELRARGCPAWYGTVWVSNAPMNRFMERIGAVPIGQSEAQGHLVNYWRKAL